MKRIRVVAAIAVAAAAISGCGGLSAIDWRNHINLRSAGAGNKKVALSQVEANEVVENAISRDLHYVTISLDSVFFRNLPGIFSGATVVLGFEIQGILPAGKAIKTVFEPKKSVGRDSFLAMDNLTVIQPFLYTGQNITMTLHFKAVKDEDTPNINGMISGAANLLKKLNPIADTIVDTAKNIFTKIFSGLSMKELEWKYSFTLYPADSVYRDKPELLFLAGRYILVATPPTSASEALRKKVNMRTLTTELKLRGNRLVWTTGNEDEYTETPYIVLNVTRYKRYPAEDTELRKAVKKVDNLYETGALENALENLKNVGAEIINDKVITQNEKNLERSLMDLRKAKIQAAMAKSKNSADEEKKFNQEQIKHLDNILKEFGGPQGILEPYEVKDFNFQKNRLERIVKEAGG
jgi:hypothetical protein